MKSCNDSWKGNDKLKHFLISFGISIVNPLLSVAIALLKEFYDNTKINNHFCWKDLVFDIIGIIFGAVIHVIILCLVL